MGADALAHVLRPLAATFGADAASDLLVGLGRADDAAVYRLNDEQASSGLIRKPLGRGSRS